MEWSRLRKRALTREMKIEHLKIDLRGYWIITKQLWGWKTDLLACVWAAKLLEHGLLRGSFVLPVPIREAAGSARYQVLIQEHTSPR